MFRRRIIMLPALALIAACDGLPTQPPAWEQTWVVPAEEIEVSVAELLPAGVDLTEDGSEFVTSVGGIARTLSLAQMCASCAALGGTTAPKPAFRDTIRALMTLPTELVSALVSGGALDLTVAHNLSFDPLRPDSDPSAERGWVVVNVMSDGVVFAHDSISGDDRPFDASVVLEPALAFQPAEVSQQIDVEILLYSPAGEAIQIDAADTLGVTIASSPVEIAEATIEADGIEFSDSPSRLDIESVDAAMIDRVRAGALRLEVDNQLGVTGGVDIAFQLPGGSISRAIAIAEGAYTTRVEFSREEIRSILEAGAVDVSTDGSVSAADGTLTVTPLQALLMDADFELVLLIGDGPEGEG